MQSRKDLAASLAGASVSQEITVVASESPYLAAAPGIWLIGLPFGRYAMTSKNSIDVRTDHLVTSTDPEHPANLICTLCRNFYNLGWVTGTGGGTSIAKNSHIFIAPSGVQKELM